MKKFKKILLLVLVILVFIGAFHVFKELPEGINYRGEDRSVPISDIKFLYDLTYENLNGEIIHEQQIFDSIFSLIENANKYILIDAFLFNSYLSGNSQSYRNLSSELADKLIEKKRSSPGIKIDFITDPINTVYGGDWNEEIESLREIGVNIIITNLGPLRDSNPVYSSVWRTFVQWFGSSAKRGLLPHPFSKSGSKVTLRSYLSMFNFKANHRKIFMADDENSITTIITSANPHDGSSAHSNVAIKITGEIWRDVYASEESVAALTEKRLAEPIFPNNKNSGSNNIKRAKTVLLTENKIKKALLEKINDTVTEEKIMIATFYLSDRKIIKALVKASKRGVEIRIILDPNKDAFGYSKIGVPNRPVAHELIKKSNNNIEIRWYDTHGEQFHSKLALIEKNNGLSTVILGSANLTGRNLNNYNLETNIKITAESNTALMRSINKYFNTVWDNDNQYYTVSYEGYKDESGLKKIIYFVQEYIGIGSF